MFVRSRSLFGGRDLSISDKMVLATAEDFTAKNLLLDGNVTLCSEGGKGEESMGKRERSWEKLDNTANIFPVIASDQMTNTYRISCCLKELVDAETLQEAVDLVTPRFPGFHVRLRRGVFWYYLEENHKPAPRVKEEHAYPCRLIHTSRNNSYLFRVSYFRDRINLEVFHALADGVGAIGFLREIVYQYLRRAHEELRREGDGLSPETSLDREDAFLRNYRRAHKNQYKSGKAYLIRGRKLPADAMGVFHGYMSLGQIREVARNRYGVSINEYLIAAYVWAVYREDYHRLVRSGRPLRVAVPVNLRPFFASETTKNFFVMVSAEFLPQKEDYSFAEIAGMIHKSLRSQITRENLEAIFSYNVSNQDYLAARAVPLPLKNLAMRFIYNRTAAANTTTITNIGNISVEDKYRSYIRAFHCFLAFSRGQGLKATITSYQDTLVFSVSSRWEGTGIQRDIFRQIAHDGIELALECNGGNE